MNVADTVLSFTQIAIAHILLLYLLQYCVFVTIMYMTTDSRLCWIAGVTPYRIGIYSNICLPPIRRTSDRFISNARRVYSAGGPHVLEKEPKHFEIN